MIAGDVIKSKNGSTSRRNFMKKDSENSYDSERIP